MFFNRNATAWQFIIVLEKTPSFFLNAAIDYILSTKRFEEAGTKKPYFNKFS